MSLVLLPRHPLHMWKYHITLYHFPSRVPLTRAPDSDLQLRKQFAPTFFHSEVLDLWPGLVCSPNLPPLPGFLLEAELSVCFHCIVGNERWGGTLVYLWVGPLGCVRRRNCAPHTIDWQARQEPRHHSSRTLDCSRSFSFLKHNSLSLNSRFQHSAVWFRGLHKVKGRSEVKEGQNVQLGFGHFHLTGFNY